MDTLVTSNRAKAAKVFMNGCVQVAGPMVSRMNRRCRQIDECIGVLLSEGSAVLDYSGRDRCAEEGLSFDGRLAMVSWSHTYCGASVMLLIVSRLMARAT